VTTRSPLRAPYIADEIGSLECACHDECKKTAEPVAIGMAAVTAGG
jgi:hypothetical protein